MDNEIRAQIVDLGTRKVVEIRQVKDTSTEYGGQATYRLLYAGTLTDDELWQRVNLEGDYCQHEYDCCGRWYKNPAIVKRDGIRTLVIQRMAQNV